MNFYDDLRDLISEALSAGADPCTVLGALTACQEELRCRMVIPLVYPAREKQEDQS